MPAKIYKVDLDAEERAKLEGMTRKGKVSARKMKRAQILLKASEGWRDGSSQRTWGIIRSGPRKRESLEFRGAKTDYNLPDETCKPIF